MPVLVAVIIALVAAVGVYRLIAPKGETTTAVQMGRKWSAWAAFLIIGGLLPPLLYKPFDINPLAASIAGMIAYPGIAFLLGWAYGKFRFRKVRTNEKSIDVATDDTYIKTGIESEFHDEEFYRLALQEIESGDTQKGLWAKCFADSEGNENKAKARYLKKRVRQLQKANGGCR